MYLTAAYTVVHVPITDLTVEYSLGTADTRVRCLGLYSVG